jgi:hypothetical protein
MPHQHWAIQNNSMMFMNIDERVILLSMGTDHMIRYYNMSGATDATRLLRSRRKNIWKFGN